MYIDRANTRCYCIIISHKAKSRTISQPTAYMNAILDVEQLVYIYDVLVKLKLRFRTLYSIHSFCTIVGFVLYID